MDRFYLVGDTHGDLSFVSRVCKAARKEGVTDIYQLGDFGVWPGDEGKYYLDTLDTNAGIAGVNWFITLGNHDDYDQIDELFGEDHGPKLLRPNITILGNKTQVFMNYGLRFASVGGAVSIDRSWRKPHRSWWPQENTTAGDLYMLEAQMSRANWDSVDILLSHDANTSLPEWEGFFKDDYPSEMNRRAMDLVLEIAKPKYQFHGHYHRYLEYAHKDTKVLGLECNPDAYGHRNSVALATVEDGKVNTRITAQWLY